MMIEQEPPRTRLEQLLRQQHVTLEEFRKNYQRAAGGTVLSERQAYRWVAGELSTLPYPAAQGTLEKMFGEPVARLFGPPYGIQALRPVRCRNGAASARGSARTDWEGQMIVMSADRARDFLSRIEASNVGAETFDQLADDVRRLVITSQQPLPSYLGDLVATQDRAFTLLEGRQRPEQTRDLYLLAGITCGLMAYASHDLGAFHDAMTQARTGYACADNAGHDGLRAWTRGIQSLITYYSGQMEDSVRYAQSGAEAAARSRGTAGIWLASSEARALAAVNQLDEAHTALARGTDARDRAEPDELDSLGGLCSFSQPRQLGYAAVAFSWGGRAEANHTERLALNTLDAYATAPAQDRNFADVPTIRGVLALARVYQGQIDGAAEALAPVLNLPSSQRIHGIVTSVERVRIALNALQDPGRDAIKLAGVIEAFTSERLTRAR
ncbi:MAG TPA: hypothetical protein VJT72_05775 [Pseudonocardiaceae bacterium]|nr:hypothetical protein [Pseudonocardiaceae bacterium]